MARPRKGLPTFKENPFLEADKGQVYTSKTKKVAIAPGDDILVNNETGEVRPTTITSFYEVDGDQFVKLYTNQIKALFDLSPSAYKFMEVIFVQVQNHALNGDTIYLNSQMAEEHFINTQRKPISKATFARVIRELIEKEIIAQSNKTNLYYINPRIFFNGDRVRFITEYKKKKKRKFSDDWKY